jgi:hypothetical protein
MAGLVTNCSEKKTFTVDMKNLFFPVDGSGIVYQEYCGKETSEYPEGDADLCTNAERNVLLCHSIRCAHYLNR